MKRGRGKEGGNRQSVTGGIDMKFVAAPGFFIPLGIFLAPTSQQVGMDCNASRADWVIWRDKRVASFGSLISPFFGLPFFRGCFSSFFLPTGFSRPTAAVESLAMWPISSSARWVSTNALCTRSPRSVRANSAKAREKVGSEGISPLLQIHRSSESGGHGMEQVYEDMCRGDCRPLLRQRPAQWVVDLQVVFRWRRHTPKREHTVQPQQLLKS